MENATKALLIAGSVLVVIAIITLGVGFLTSAEEQMGNADLTEYQVQQFNGKFDKYEGTKSGSDVNALLETVFNHNISKDDAGERVAVMWVSKGKNMPTDWANYGVDAKGNINTATKPSAPFKKVSTANKYTVTMQYNTNTSLIEKITINGI